MQLGDVLRKERERKDFSIEDLASQMGLSSKDYGKLEASEAPFESSGRLLGRIAIKLETPTSRLISVTGKSAQACQKQGQCGQLIRRQRERRKLPRETLADQLEISVAELSTIENGESDLEMYAPILLRFAEIIEQPVFNLLYPCGLPVDQLDDYP